MDMNTLRGIATLIVMIGFIAVCWWAFSPKRRKRFKDAAQLPFADETRQEQKVREQSEKKTDTESEDENRTQ